jgi:hypothetical protein
MQTCRQCMHLKQCDCHTYFMVLTEQTELLGRKQVTYSEVTYKSLQQWEVILPLVPFALTICRKVCRGFPLLLILRKNTTSFMDKQPIFLEPQTGDELHSLLYACTANSKCCTTVYLPYISGYLKLFIPYTKI